MATSKNIPANEGKVGYKRPPLATRFKPGKSGNPSGRPSAGATLREWCNQLAAQNLTAKQLRKIARDSEEGWTRRAAAERILRTLEAGDIADMQGWLDGEIDLQGLRAKGVNTEVIKKAKTRKKIVYHDKESGETHEVEEREIELHDRAGIDFDRVTEHTAGKATQPVQIQGAVKFTLNIANAGASEPSDN